MSYFNIIKLNATPSTNDFLKEKHQKGVCQDGDLVWAKNQTSGRGQRDKMWISNPKDSLTFSVYKTYDHFPTTNNFLISMAVSLGIINALQSFNIPNLCIKWPNDILSENKKICGLLIENLYRGKKLEASIVGIGLNVNQINFGELNRASSMRLCSGRAFNLEEVLQQILTQLAHILERKLSVAASFKAYNKALFGVGEQRTFLEDGKAFLATVEEVNQQGDLVLKAADNERRFFQHKTIEWVY